jgi:hypothetical protein
VVLQVCFDFEDVERRLWKQSWQVRWTGEQDAMDGICVNIEEVLGRHEVYC